MKWKMRTKLTVSFAAVAIIFFLVSAFLVNRMITSQFERFSASSNMASIRKTVDMFEDAYVSGGYEWNDDHARRIGLAALQDGLVTRLVDVNGSVIWDAEVHNNGFCTSMLAHMADNMKSYSASFKGEYTVKQLDIYVGDTTVGKLTVGYYGPFFISDEELMLIKSIDGVLAWAFSVTLAFSGVIGFMIARRISKPLTALAERTKAILSSDYDKVEAVKSNTAEISELSDYMDELAASLKRKDELRKRLTSDLTHEFRTPLTSIKTQLELIQEGVYKADDERMESIFEDYMRIEKLVGDLETLSQSDIRSSEAMIGEVDVRRILDRAIACFEGELRGAGGRVETYMEPLVMESSEESLSAIFTNIISNGIKYRDVSRPLMISVRSVIDGYGDRVLISFEDNGMGIPEEELENVFERFYRADRSRNSSVPGSGIGLTIARTHARSLGGDLTVKSALGKGSTFTLDLPRKR